MKWPVVICTLLRLARAGNSTSVRALYLFKDLNKSNTTAITCLGFNTVVILGIGISQNSDIMYYSNTPGVNDTIIATQGEYVGGDSLSKKALSLKTNPLSTIERVEIAANALFIKELMEHGGDKTDSMLGRNLAAVKWAWGVDAFNNIDDTVFDVESSVAFAGLVRALGFNYTITPNSNTTYCAEIKKATLPGVLDRIYVRDFWNLQLGMENDNMAYWTSALQMQVVEVIWTTNNFLPDHGFPPDVADHVFSRWLKTTPNPLSGGAYWNDYDIETTNSSYEAYAAVLNRLFP